MAFTPVGGGGVCASNYHRQFVRCKTVAARCGPCCHFGVDCRGKPLPVVFGLQNWARCQIRFGWLVGSALGWVGPGGRRGGRA